MSLKLKYKTKRLSNMENKNEKQVNGLFQDQNTENGLFQDQKPTLSSFMIDNIRKLTRGSGVFRLRLAGGSDIDSDVSLSDLGSLNATTTEDEQDPVPEEEAGASGEYLSASSSVCLSLDSKENIEEMILDEDYLDLVNMVCKEVEDPNDLYIYYIVPTVIDHLDKGVEVNDQNLTEIISKELENDYKLAKSELGKVAKEVSRLEQSKTKLEAEGKQLASNQKSLLDRFNENKVTAEKAATAAKIAYEQFNLNKERLSKYSKNSTIFQEVNELRKDAEKVGTFKAYKEMISKSDLRKCIYTAAHQDELDSQIDEIESSGSRLIDRVAFYSYLADHRHLRGVDEILQHAFHDNVQTLINADEFLRRLDAKVLPNDQVEVHIPSVKQDSVLHKIIQARTDPDGKIKPGTLKIDEKVPIVEKIRLAKYYNELYDSISEIVNRQRGAKSKSTSSKGSIPENVVKTKNRFELYNKLREARIKGDKDTKFIAATAKEAIAPVVQTRELRDIDKHAIKTFKESQNVRSKEKSATDRLMKDASKHAKALRSSIINDSKELISQADNKSKVRDIIAREAQKRNDEAKKHAASALKEIQHNTKSGRSFATSRVVPHNTILPSGAPNTKFVKKSGDHSVHINGVIDAELNPALSNTGQNAFEKARAYIYDTRNQVRWDERTLTWQIKTTAFAPVEVSPIKSAKYTMEWDRFVSADALPERTRINLALPQRKDFLDPSTATDYVKNGTVIQTKPTADSISSVLEVPKHIAETIAPKFMDNLVRYNNKSLFMQGFILASMIQDLENAKIPFRLGPGSADAIANIELNPPHGHAEILTNALDEANAKGRFVFESRFLSKADITILKILGSGPSIIEGQNIELQHLFQSFDFQSPKFAIVGKDLPNEHPMTNITSDQVWNFLHRMAHELQMKTDYVEGANLAVRVMNGNVKHCGARGVYFTCTMEMRQMDIPKPHYHNFLWRVLKQEPREVVNEHLMNEFNHLSYMTVNEFQLSATLLSAMVSTCVSTVLNKYNVTGREVNELYAAQPQVPNAAPLMRKLFHIQDRHDRAAIFPLAFGLMNQIYGINMNSSAYIDSGWSAQMQWDSRLLQPTEGWQGVWPNRVPYMFDPIVMGPFVTALPLEWGFSRPRMSFEITKECINTGDLDHQGWYASAGDRRYDANLSGGRGNRFIEYGLMATNFILQHDPFNIQELYMGYEVRANVSGTTRIVAIDMRAAQPMVDRLIPHIIPGTLLTWDYATERQLVPVVYRESFPEHMFEILTSVRVHESQYAGILWEAALMGEPLMNANTITDEFAAMDIYTTKSGPGGGGARFGAKEN